MAHSSTASHSISFDNTAALRKGGAVALGSVFVALAAHVSIPLFFTPVPLTLQTFAVLVLGLLLGPAAAFTSLALYLAEGLAGLPVFSPHGLGGILQIMGPTGGYLLAYPFAAALAGALYHRAGKRGNFTLAALSAAAGSLVILVSGALWLAALTHQSAHAVLALAVTPFLPGDILKVAAAAAVAVGAHRVIAKRNDAAVEI